MIREMNHIEALRSQLRGRIYYKYGSCISNLGPGRIIGVLILLSYFTVLPSLLKMLWPFLLNNFSGISSCIQKSKCMWDLFSS